MKLIEQLPFFYEEIKEVNKIQDSFDIERNVLEENFTDFINQLFVKTSDRWGIELWEEFFGIKENDFINLELRKANVLAKIKGNNTSTVVNIKKICEGFTDGLVEVVEEAESYRFMISISKGGINDTGELIKRIEEVKPAHIAYEIVTAISNIIKFYSSKTAIRQEYFKTSRNLKVSNSQKNTKSEVYEHVEQLY